MKRVEIFDSYQSSSLKTVLVKCLVEDAFMYMLFVSRELSQVCCKSSLTGRSRTTKTLVAGENKNQSEADAAVVAFRGFSLSPWWPPLHAPLTS